MAVELNENNFKTQVLDCKGTVLVDFWAVWCGPCQMMTPVIESLEQERKDIKICKVNVDEQPSLAANYNVRAIPTFVAFKDGKPVGSAVGVSSKEELISIING